MAKMGQDFCIDVPFQRPSQDPSPDILWAQQKRRHSNFGLEELAVSKSIAFLEAQLAHEQRLQAYEPYQVVLRDTSPLRLGGGREGREGSSQQVSSLSPEENREKEEAEMRLKLRELKRKPTRSERMVELG